MVADPRSFLHLLPLLVSSFLLLLLLPSAPVDGFVVVRGSGSVLPSTFSSGGAIASSSSTGIAAVSTTGQRRRRRRRRRQERRRLSIAPPVPAFSAGVGLGRDFDDDASGGGGDEPFSVGAFPDGDGILSYLGSTRTTATIPPPATREVLKLATESYVYGGALPGGGRRRRRDDAARLLRAAIAEEHRSFDVPVDVVVSCGDDDEEEGTTTVTIDVSKTGDDLDESVAEILSLAAMYRLPAEVALELLGGNATATAATNSDGSTDKVSAEADYKGNGNNNTASLTSAISGCGGAAAKTKTSLDLCRTALSERGWDAISFPRGLALEPRRKSAAASPTASPATNPLANIFFGRNRRRRIEDARNAVNEAKSTKPPPRRELRTREEFLATLEEQFGLISPSSSASSSYLEALPIFAGSGDEASSSVVVGGATNTKLLFFPDSAAPISSSTKGISWKRIKRATERQFAKLRKKGRAGIVSYCFFNFALYTAGFLYRWPRVAPADPFSAASVHVVCMRKFSRIFVSLYLSSQILKLPRLFFAVSWTPVAGRCLSSVQERLRVSETVATVLLIGTMLAMWAASVSVPLLSEYATLKRLVDLDRLIN